MNRLRPVLVATAVAAASVGTGAGCRSGDGQPTAEIGNMERVPENPSMTQPTLPNVRVTSRRSETVKDQVWIDLYAPECDLVDEANPDTAPLFHKPDGAGPDGHIDGERLRIPEFREFLSALVEDPEIDIITVRDHEGNKFIDPGTHVSFRVPLPDESRTDVNANTGATMRVIQESFALEALDAACGISRSQSTPSAPTGVTS